MAARDGPPYLCLQDALDRVPSNSRDYPMALFKRAHAPARIEAAKANADGMTRALIARERLFQ